MMEEGSVKKVGFIKSELINKTFGDEYTGTSFSQYTLSFLLEYCFSAQAEYSYFSAHFRLKIFL